MTGRLRTRSAALLTACTLGLLGVAGCDNGSQIEPSTEEPDSSSPLPDADEVDEQLDDEEDDG